MGESLGAWEDRPQRNFEADVTAVDLDSREVFVLTRIDGVANVAELCAMSGLEQAEALRALERLVALGLVVIEEATGPRRSIMDPRPRPGLPSGGTPRPRMAEARNPDTEPFFGVAPEDVAYLQSRGRLGFVPGRPFAEPGSGRFGHFVFDRRELLVRCDLSLDQKREIIFLTQTTGQLDHFEFFGAEPTDDRKELKKAYFVFSRRFHPDAHFRKDVGPFQERLERLFKLGTELHDALAADEELRRRYKRAIEARNTAYRDALDDLRVARARVVQAAKLREAVGRKDDLRELLEARTKARRATGANNPVAERLQKAARFYEQGMSQYKDEQFIAAASSLQLAVTYDPKNETYHQAFEKVNEKALQARATTLWKRGYMEESVGRVKEAIISYREAVEIYPRAEYCAHVAELMVTYDDDLRAATRLAQKAVDADPQNVDYLLLLGRLYAQVNLAKKAVGVLEKAVKLDPKNDEAKKALKAVKRM